MSDPAALYAEARRHTDSYAASLRRKALLTALGSLALAAYMYHFVIQDAWRTGELMQAFLSALLPVLGFVFTAVVGWRARRAGADDPILVRGTIARKEVRPLGKGRVERLLFVDAEAAHRLSPAGAREPVPELLTKAVKPRLRASHDLFGSVEEGDAVTLVVGPDATAIAKLPDDGAQSTL